MVEQRVADAIVIGGGIAGMMAANRTAQHGLSVVVLEQSGDDRYLCNTRYTGGTFHICQRDIMADENILAQAVVDTTAGFVSGAMAGMLAHDGRRVVRWLQQEGVRFIKASPAEYHNWVLAPPGRTRPGLDWEGRSGDVMLRTLEANLVKRGCAVLRATRAQRLLMQDGKCAGVTALQHGAEVTFSAPFVVIADGGYQGNADLVRRYICKQPERLKQRSAGTGCGDGLSMALAAGARLVGTDRFYGHVLSRDAMNNDRLWPYPYLDALVTAGVVVDASGARFVDEGRGGVFVANAIARLDDPFASNVVFDRAIWEGAGRAGLIPANPHLANEGGTLLQAPDVASLAKQMGVPADALQRTIDAYNQSVSGGDFAALAPGRSEKKFKPQPIAVAPFYAAPLCCGITATMGGIAIDENAQALREDGSVLAGVYAAGGASGGLEGGPEIGYVGGLVKCGVTALRAAEHLAGLLGKSGTAS